MKNFFDRIFKKDKKFVYTTRNLGHNTGNGERIGRDTISGSVISDWVISSTDNIEKKVDERKSVEPIEVFNELKQETPKISFDNLEEKIKVVSERIKVLKEHLTEDHLNDENRTLFYLKNRQKYLKTKSKTPFDWSMTTKEAVDDLCKRYKLKIVGLKQYYTLVPKEGIKEMERYTKAYKAVTGDNPIFELVIKDTEEKATKKKDRDPILLANSPIGNFLFVIGAWDDEVEIVDEIIYGFK